MAELGFPVYHPLAPEPVSSIMALSINYQKPERGFWIINFTLKTNVTLFNETQKAKGLQ